jgi:NADH-quinone oxidoreductase subunit C
MSETSGMPSMTSPPPRLTTEYADNPHFATLVTAVQGAFPDSVEQVVVDRGELTLHLDRAALVGVARLLRDDKALHFEVLSGVSGVDYPEVDRRLHAVYHLLSMTHRRRVRLEVAVTVEDPHVPSLVGVYPTADWHERETYDFFGIIFDGHPQLARIQMPDDWEGHPQRKDYPLGGVPVQYKGATIPPPDERRLIE